MAALPLLAPLTGSASLGGFCGACGRPIRPQNRRRSRGTRAPSTGRRASARIQKVASNVSMST